MIEPRTEGTQRMSEKLQEWIEAVEWAARRKQQRADYILDAAAKYPTNTIGRGKQQAIDDATRLTELAAYLRAQAAAPEPLEQFRNQLHRRMAAAAIGYFAMCCYALPAPPAALAMPGGEG